MNAVRDLPSFARWPVAVVALGDVGAVLLFAAAGRAAHGEQSNPILHTIGVALPFLVGWFGAGLLLGTYRDRALRSFQAAITRTTAAWLVGGTVGLAIRSGVERRIVPLAFVLVALTFVLAVLLLWRTAVVLLHRPPRG